MWIIDYKWVSMMENKKIVMIFALFVLQSCDDVWGLQCYECKLSEWCILSNGYANECTNKYCTIYRQEYIDPAGQLVKFYRSCEDHPDYFNTIITTAEYKTYYSSCTTDLCNSGDGTDVDDITPNEDSSPFGGAIVIQGIGVNTSPSQLGRDCVTVIIVVLIFIHQVLA